MIEEYIEFSDAVYLALNDMVKDYRFKHGLDGAFDTLLVEAEKALINYRSVRGIECS